MAEDLIIFLIGMAGVGVGGIITYLVQKSIQKRTWMKEKADKVYAPILDELYNVEADLYKLTSDSLSYPILHGIREKHLLHWIKPKLRSKLGSFETELHNFVISLISAINIIKEQMKKEILQRIKDMHKEEVQRTTPFSSEFIWNGLAKLVLKKEDTGGFLGVSRKRH